MHVLNHRGKHFSVRGPLNVLRPPQGRPVQVQAGSSEAGKELAAHYAEVVFTAQNSLESAQAFTLELKDRTEKAGRPRDSIRVIAGVQTIIGDTIEDAQAKYRQMQELIHPEVGRFLLQVRTEVRIFGASSQSHVVRSIPTHEEV